MRAILRMSYDPFVGISYIRLPPSIVMSDPCCVGIGSIRLLLPSLANTAKMSINLFQILVGFGRAMRLFRLSYTKKAADHPRPFSISI
jgi:hypothetical protein